MNTLALNTFDANCDSNCADPCSPGCRLEAFALSCGDDNCNSCYCIIPVSRRDHVFALASQDGMLMLHLRDGVVIAGALIVR